MAKSKFLWGAATSSHQIEGGLDNNWSRWEDTEAQELITRSTDRFEWTPNWKLNKAEADQPDTYKSGDRINHFERFKEDISLMKKIGINTYRFSIEWSRIEPSKGVFSTEGISFYKRFIAELLKNDIEPIVTLWHWTIPIWLRDEGGWTSHKFPEYFEKFTDQIVKNLGENVNYWITINEPNIVSTISLLYCDWPPNKKNPLLMYKSIQILIKAHKKSYALIKRAYPKSQVSISKNLTHFDEGAYGRFSKQKIAVARYLTNDYFIKKIRNHLDYLGVNHYFTASKKLEDHEKYPLSDLGWSISPQFFSQFLQETYERYELPIFITEHGLADRSDRYRPEFIRETFKQISDARDQGVEMIGYCHWSLLDNFEWDKGYWPRFGLIEVDEQGNRRIRKSGYLYRDLISYSEKNTRSDPNFINQPRPERVWAS